MNLCLMCLKRGIKNCPLYNRNPSYIRICSAYIGFRKKIEELREDYEKSYEHSMHIRYMYLERLNKLDEYWTRQQEDLDSLHKKFNSLKDDCDEMFNRVEHHSSFYDRFIRAEKRITALETYKKELRAFDSLDNIYKCFDNIDNRIEKLENPEVIIGFDPAGSMDDGLVEYKDEFTITEKPPQKYICSKCDIEFIRVGDHYECDKKCKNPSHTSINRTGHDVEEFYPENEKPSSNNDCKTCNDEKVNVESGNDCYECSGFDRWKPKQECDNRIYR